MVTIEYNDNIAPITNIMQHLFNLQGIIPLIHCRAMWSLTGPVQTQVYFVYYI